MLARAVAEYGENDNWKRVALCVPGRTNKACRKRWLHSLSPSVRKTAWTPEEDQLLLDLHAIHAGKWAAIAKQIPGRTDDACSKRYREALDPMLKKGEWTTEEDGRLMEVYKELGGRWGQVGGLIARSRLFGWRLLERKKATNKQEVFSLDYNMQQQQIPFTWENTVDTAPFQYASSSLSSALVVVTPDQSIPQYTYPSASSPSYANLPSTSTSPPVGFTANPSTTTTAMYDEGARPFDQLHRHTPVSDDFYITPATHEDRRMSLHPPSSYSLQHPDRVHSSLSRSDLFYHPDPSYTSSRDRPCEDTSVPIHQPRAQYYPPTQPTEQLQLSSRPPTSSQHDVPYVQQQSNLLVGPSSPSIPQHDPGPPTDHFYPASSQPHGPLVHRSTSSLSKSSITSSPYPKQPIAIAPPSQPIQDEPGTSADRPRQRTRPSVPRKRPDAQAPLRLSSDLPAAADPNIKPYACGHDSCWPANASISRACYSTSRGLSDHNKAAHPDDSINGLQYHLQISKAHFQHAITNTYLTPYVDGLSVPASVEASTSSQIDAKKKQYVCPHENCPNRYKQLSGLRYHLAHGHPADLPAQLDLVPPALSRKLEEKMRVQAQAQGDTLPAQASNAGLHQHQHQHQHQRP
ncbi:hypothetical protein ID866_1381 [Astraeus odoratus]|nr:hypothetical protein ID866_1381 [Astraeus odoratus]